MEKNALILFIKHPQPGRVKTRLQPDLTPEQSFQLYRAMVEDLTSAFSQVQDFAFYVFFWPDDRAIEVGDWLGKKLQYVAQSPGNLGEKMHRAFLYSIAGGHEKTIIIGSDLPTIAPPLINHGFEMLDSHDLVLGPAADGGYYLIGLKAAKESLFSNVEWSTETVFEQTLANALRDRWRVGQLPVKSDIDTISEVRALWTELQSSTGMAQRAKNTARTLQSIFG